VGFRRLLDSGVSDSGMGWWPLSLRRTLGSELFGLRPLRCAPVRLCLRFPLECSECLRAWLLSLFGPLLASLCPCVRVFVPVSCPVRLVLCLPLSLSLSSEVSL
jgi:hypothetical protein